jgi:hypothetical protein
VNARDGMVILEFKPTKGDAIVSAIEVQLRRAWGSVAFRLVNTVLEGLEAGIRGIFHLGSIGRSRSQTRDAIPVGRDGGPIRPVSFHRFCCFGQTGWPSHRETNRNR